jgi:phytoene/squalene synthetase
MRFESNRAWQYYAEAAPLLELISRDSRAALWTLRQIYSRILEKIEAIGYDVLSRPHPGLSAAEKAWIMIRAGARLWKPEMAG